VRIDVSDMVGRPGTTRDVVETLPRADVGAPGAGWGPADEALRSPLGLRLVLEMLVDGLLVRGGLTFETAVPCARCLADVQAEHAVEVSEMYLDPDRLEEEDEVEAGYELHRVEGWIDLEALIRDAVLGVIPVRVLCRADCAGLCPTCGADLNTDPCGHTHEPEPDPRWAVLERLDLPPG
jgi:uncharacterized protein